MRLTRPNLKLARRQQPLPVPEPPRKRRLGPALLAALAAHALLGLAIGAVRLEMQSRPLAVAVTVPVGSAWSGDVDLNHGSPPPPPAWRDFPEPPEPVLPLPVAENHFPVVPIEVIALTGPTLETWSHPVAEPGNTELTGAGTAGAPSANAGVTGGTGAVGGPAGGTGTGDGFPVYVRNPRPRYPLAARQQGWQGTTVLRVEIRSDGRAGTVEVAQSSGHEVLDEAAIAAVRNARFQSAATTWVEVPITFRLNQS